MEVSYHNRKDRALDALITRKTFLKSMYIYHNVRSEYIFAILVYDLRWRYERSACKPNTQSEDAVSPFGTSTRKQKRHDSRRTHSLNRKMAIERLQ